MTLITHALGTPEWFFGAISGICIAWVVWLAMDQLR